jgi:hypothetical protein
VENICAKGYLCFFAATTMNKLLAAMLFSLSLLTASDAAFAGPKKKSKSNSSNANLKQSFRAIGHGFRDAGRAVGRDAKAATRAVKKSEKRK